MATLGIPSNTIEVLQKYHFNFQKKFGQNFLIDTHVLEKIMNAAQISKDDCVVEVGPGIGTMTQYLAERAGHVVAVEIDKALIPILSDTLSAYDNVEVINEDILKVDLNRLVQEKNGESPIKGGGRLVVIDGGFCRAYHEKTGIAGYTLVYSSRTMSLRTHQPFESAEKAVRENLDILSQKNILETENHRILVEDTDEGEVLRERVHDLKQLVTAYQLGWIPEARCEDHVW